MYFYFSLIGLFENEIIYYRNSNHKQNSFQIYISQRGIKIVAPSLKNESKEVALQLHIKEIVRILVHFGKGLPVIFLYTTSKCGIYIRKTLDMIDELG